VLRTRFVHWTTPLTSSLPLGTFADLARSKSELMAENALLRQQLIILIRVVKLSCPSREIGNAQHGDHQPTLGAKKKCDWRCKYFARRGKVVKEKEKTRRGMRA